MKNNNMWSIAKDKQNKKINKSIKEKNKKKTSIKDFEIEDDKTVIEKRIAQKNSILKKKENLTNDSLEEKMSNSKRIRDHSNSYKKTEKISPFNIKGWKFIIATIILIVLIIVLPIAILFGSGYAFISGGKSLYISNGFMTDNTKHTFDKTIFSLEHIDSGKYIDYPSSNINNELPMTLTSDPNNYNFTIYGEKFSNLILPLQDLALQLAYQPYYLIPGEQPKLAKQPIDIQNKDWEKMIQIGFYQDGGNDRFSIYSKSEKKFLGDPDHNDIIQWSTKPVWWRLEAQDKQSGGANKMEINTPDEFNSEYWSYEEIVNKPEFLSGIHGRTMSIQSSRTNDYLNTENFIEEFYDNNTGTVVNKQSTKKVNTNHLESFNFFVSDILNGKIQIGSFANNTVNIRPTSTDPITEGDWFPLLVSEGDELRLETKSNETGSWATWKQSYITLERNPLDLREFAINFKDIDQTDRYLSTENQVHIDYGKTVTNPNYIPEYFRFNTSKINSENITSSVSRTRSTSATYKVIAPGDEDNVYKVQFRAKAYKIDPITGKPTTLLHDSKWKNYKLVGGNSKIKIRGLKRNTEYNDVQMRIIRDGNSAKHVTTYLVEGFKTVDWNLPDLPDPGDDVAENASLIEKKLNLKNDPGTTMTAVLDFQNGEGTQIVTKIEMKAYELDANQNKVGIPKKSTKRFPISGQHEFNFTGLKPETEYWVTTQYSTIGNHNDDEKDDTNGIPLPSPNGAASGVYSMTTKTHRRLPVGEIKEAALKNESGYNVLETKIFLDMATIKGWGGTGPSGDDLIIEVKNKQGTLVHDYRTILLELPTYLETIKFPQTPLSSGDTISIGAYISMNDYLDDPQIYNPGGTDRFSIHSINITL